MGSEGPEFLVLQVRDGELAHRSSWVYAWIDAGGLVVYVGATGLDPATRVWLHLHDPDPDLGRMAARFDEVATAELDVLAMRVPAEISRADVRDIVGARLADEQLLAPEAITDHLEPLLEPSPEAVELADRFVARLRTYVRQRGPQLL